MQIVNLILRPDIPLRGPVAFEAPFHIERLSAASERHLIERAVAGGAADSFRDVDAVVEINEVGQIVDPVPFDWLVSR